jgi:hypothetical protein
LEIIGTQGQWEIVRTGWIVETIEEIEQQIKEAIAFHLDGLREEGLPIPEPTTLCEYVEAC